MHQQITQTAPRGAHSGKNRLGTCLIVEDSEFDSIKMARIVHHSLDGMQVKVATTLASARKAMGVGVPSLILLDNNLPDGLGAEFAIELARARDTAGIPVIMVSDWPSPFMWEKAASAGVHYVLNKAEFNGHYLISALQKDKRRRARLN